MSVSSDVFMFLPPRFQTNFISYLKLELTSITMDDDKFKQNYQKYKVRVKMWEKDFKKKFNRIPSKVIIPFIEFFIFSIL